MKKTISSSCANYNEISSTIQTPPFPVHITENEPLAENFSNPEHLDHDYKIRKKIIGLSQKATRADEEVSIVCNDMEKCFQFCMKSHTLLLNKIDELRDEEISHHVQSHIALLADEVVLAELLMKEMSNSFKSHTAVPDVNYTRLQDGSPAVAHDDISMDSDSACISDGEM